MWQNEKYIYSSGLLQRIAWCYESIYDGIPILSSEITDPFSVAEFKADFDIALNAIGRGEWHGDIEDKEFGDFGGFGKLQRLVVADILRVSDNELEVRGFYQIPQGRGRAYKWMANFLNGLPYGDKFISSH